MKLKGLYPHTQTGIFYFQPPTLNGVRPKPISLGTKDENEAIEQYQALAGMADVTLTEGQLRGEMGRYVEIKHRSGFHSRRTHDELVRLLGKFSDFAGVARKVSEIDQATIRRWKAELERDGASPSSVRTYLNRLRGFFTWAMEERMIRANPVKGIAVVRQMPTRAERYCTREERETLIENCGREDLALTLWLGFFAGLRRQEIVEARPEWVDLEAGVLTVQNTPTFQPKDKEHRRIRLCSRLREFLAGYGLRAPYLLRPEKERGKWRYRVDLSGAFRRYVKAQELDWVTMHTMRHTFATMHALAGTPLSVIARELGDDLETTYRHYVGYSRHEAHAEAIV